VAPQIGARLKRTICHECVCGATNRSTTEANHFPRACLWCFSNLSRNRRFLVQFQFLNGVEEEVVALVLLHTTLKKKKMKHIFWIHPVDNSRQERGMFYTTFNDL
jgi:hypothetical protein